MGIDRICKPSPSLSNRQCCGFGGVLSFSLSIRSMAWFCSVEIGGAMVVGLVWVFCVPMVVAFDLWLIFCCGMCGFDGGGGGGDGFTVWQKGELCLYGGEDVNWIWKFTTTAKAVAETAGINLELVYVGKNKDGQYYLEDQMKWLGPINSVL
ncbi:protein sieve element occlusion a [Quercus suber]|uniref:Protein sieve element occlusion a n=1 Tax=Quercus suber TaxID=58331 RepID=A0AAW0LLD4_QUESU